MSRFLCEKPSEQLHLRVMTARKASPQEAFEHKHPDIWKAMCDIFDAKKGNKNTITNYCSAAKKGDLNLWRRRRFEVVKEKEIWACEGEGDLKLWRRRRFELVKEKEIWACEGEGDLSLWRRRRFELVKEKEIWTCEGEGDLSLWRRRRFELVKEKEIWTCEGEGDLKLWLLIKFYFWDSTTWCFS